MIKYIVNWKNGVVIKDRLNGDKLVLERGDELIYNIEYDEGEINTGYDRIYHFNFSKYLINKIKKYGYEWEEE